MESMSWAFQRSSFLDIHGKLRERFKVQWQRADRPRSIWTTSVFDNVEFTHKYMNNSMAKESPEMDRIREAVKEAGIFVVLGYSERDGGSLYASQSFINPEGKIVLHRRKIKPTRRWYILLELMHKIGSYVEQTLNAQSGVMGKPTPSSAPPIPPTARLAA